MADETVPAQPKGPSDDDGHSCNSQNAPTSRPICCCGQASCIYLRHNNEALDGLEKDVKTAAQLGQALLVRHEAYIAEAEASRRQMSARIDALETDKSNLEAENARTVQENHELFAHLEEMNSTVSESERHVQNLEASLHSTHMELRRLEALAGRTHDLEVQLMELGREQESLKETLVFTEAEERIAIRRWKGADRRLGEVQEQLERIEREAHQEKERYEEVLRRMERRKLVDKELQAGKATVAAGHGTSVVSHFVKDILQDNVNLQMGIVELRDLLMSSNDEVQKLREQLMIHQPLGDGVDEDETASSSLRAELAGKGSALSRELHVHHHYHAPPKKDEGRRKKKRNASLNLHPSTPSRSNSQSQRMRPNQSVAATILTQTSSTVPRPRNSNKYPEQSSNAPPDFASTAPSSPQSNFRNSIFDRMPTDQNIDSSRPTSPGSSNDPASPVLRTMHRKHPSGFSAHSRKGSLFQTGTIQEEEDSDVSPLQGLEAPRRDSLVFRDDSSLRLDSTKPPNSFDPSTFRNHRPRRSRSASHESILSVSGIDIHTLKSKPSQIIGSRAMLRPEGLSSPSTSLVSTQPILSAELSTPTMSRQKYDSSSLLRSTIGIPPPPATEDNGVSGETKRLGGWIWNRWGMSPSPSQSRTTSAVPPPAPKSAAQGAAGTAVKADAIAEPTKKMMGRPPGINQRGPIPGFWRAGKTPSQVKPAQVDWESLKEGLEE